jgi:glycerol-3-phosphate dehydrogenase
MFPQVKISEKDIESSWAGVRPLIYEEGKNASEISRKDEIWESKSGLLTIAGGKLTGYRKMAETIVDLLASKLMSEEARRITECTTKTLPISGGNVGGSLKFEAFIAKQIPKGMAAGLTKAESVNLASMYGSNAETVFELLTENEKDAVKYGLPLSLFAKLVYGIENEMVANPIDFFNRRTGAILFNIQLVQEWKSQVIAYMADKLNWTDQEKKKYSLALEKDLNSAIVPVDEQEPLPRAVNGN